MIAGEKDLVDAIWAYSVLHGATPSPYDALNALRGIRTLAVRVRQQSETAQYLAESLTKKVPPQLSAEVFQIILIPLNDRAIFHRRILDWHNVVQLLARNDEAADMLREVTRESL